MKPALFAVLCACSAPRSVEIAAPLASATAAPAHDEVAIPKGARRIAKTENAPWAADFPPSKKFAPIDVPSAARVVFVWRVGKAHLLKSGENEDEEYVRTHTVAPVDLVVRARGETRTIWFGDFAGGVAPLALSFCSLSRAWQTHASIAATFSIGIIQGGDDMTIVRDDKNGAGTLHVLHRETSDGSCTETKQGPLDVCEGFEWERAADIRLASGTQLYELVELDGKTFDCGME
jgi:hypothetical protein